MSQGDPSLEELDRELLARVRAGKGPRATKRAPFALFLRRNFEWFEERHTEHAMTWRAWTELMAARGMRNIDGGPLTPRALRGAYDREKRARAGKPPGRRGAGRAPPDTDRPAAARAVEAGPPPPRAAEPPDVAAAAPAARRGFRPAGGEKGAGGEED